MTVSGRLRAKTRWETPHSTIKKPGIPFKENFCEPSGLAETRPLFRVRIPTRRAQAMGDEPADEIGVRCDVEDCENRIVGLDDGWEYGRGLVCQDCIDFNDRHGHWPDDDREWCRQCVLDNGGMVHDCPKGSVDVLVRPGEDCPHCDFEVAMP
jgi:hypothetical protein